MLNDSRKALGNYRLEKATECLKSAKVLIDVEDYMTAANRAYYSMFHAMRAIMALDGEDRKKHSGVVAYFQEHYIKSGIFDKQYSYIIKDAFLVRQETDYEDFYVISKEDAITQYENAKKFVAAVKEYIDCFNLKL